MPARANIGDADDSVPFSDIQNLSLNDNANTRERISLHYNIPF
jgi:hypothetical protein